MRTIGILISQLNSGGAERVASHLTKILSSQYKVYLILFEDTYIEYEYSGKLCSLNVPAAESGIKKAFTLIRRIIALNKVIKKERIECIISLLDSPNIVNAFSTAQRKIVSVRNYENYIPRNFKQTLYLSLLKEAYKRADKIVAVSKVIQSTIETTFDVPEYKTITIYNPYNFDEIIQKKNEKLTDEEELFFENHYVFINVSRIMYQKGIWHLIKAFSRVNEANPQVRLVLVGEDLSDGKLQGLIEQLCLQDSILLTGRVNNPFKYLARSHTYVLSSLFEGFPNSMVEAMSCGIPIIAADCKSGPREILNSNCDLLREYDSVTICDYGIMVPTLENDENWSGDVYTEGERFLESAMLQMIEDDDLRKNLSKKSQLRSRVFDYSCCKESFVSIIE